MVSIKCSNLGFREIERGMSPLYKEMRGGERLESLEYLCSLIGREGELRISRYS